MLIDFIVLLKTDEINDFEFSILFINLKMIIYFKKCSNFIFI